MQLDSDAELQAWPPVLVVPREAPQENAQAVTTETMVAVVAGSDYAITVDTMTDDVRRDFTALIASLHPLADVPASVGMETTEVRAAYHAFARAFWAWRSPSGAGANSLSPAFAGKTMEVSSDPLGLAAYQALSSKLGWKVLPGKYAYFDESESKLRFSLGGFVGEVETNDVTDLTVTDDNKNWLDPDTSIIHEAVMGKCLHAHTNGTLNFRTDERYLPDNYSEVGPAWSIKRDADDVGLRDVQLSNVLPDLALALTGNAALRVFAANGLYDLATPFSARRRRSAIFESTRHCADMSASVTILRDI